MVAILMSGPGLLRRFSDEDNVRVDMTAEYAEASAVRGPTEVENLLRIKVGDLSATRAVKRLHPEIVHPVFADRVGHRLPIRREVQASVRNPLVRINQTWWRRFRRGLQERDLILRIRILRCWHGSQNISENLTIGRRTQPRSCGKGSGNSAPGEKFGFSRAIHRYSPKLLQRIVPVICPFPVCRTDRSSIVLSVGQFHGICAVGVSTPYVR